MNTSVIIIHETNCRYDYESIWNWFASSELEAREAADLFDAIDKMSDFTDIGCPDVFLVKLRPGSQQEVLIREFDKISDGFEVPIAVVTDMKSADEKRPFNFGSVGGLKADLDLPVVGLA